MCFLLMFCTGKFGVVYKGKLASDDGNSEVVAIKTIKCKLFQQSHACVAL